MPEKPPETPEELARQVAQHIASLKSAGVEWVPNEPLAQANPAQTQPTVALPMVAADPAAVQVSLFTAPTVEAAPLGDTDLRRHELALLAQRVAACTRCPQLASTRTQTVFGVGPIDPDLCFIGEAPGADEDRIGEPFVGVAGQLLTRIIEACGMKREEVYICNILRCRPPGNRQPQPDEAEHCREWLEKTLELVRPRFICAMGNTPRQYLLGLTQGVTKLRGRFFDYRGIPVMLTFHPSYLLRRPEDKGLVWEDMKSLLARMGRPVPGKAK